MSAVTLAPEATAGIRSAQDALEQHAARLVAVGDPIAPAISAIAAAVGAQNRLAVDAFLKTEKLIEDGRKPWGRDGTWYASEHATPLVTIIHDGGHPPPKDLGQRIAEFFKAVSPGQAK